MSSQLVAKSDTSECDSWDSASLSMEGKKLETCMACEESTNTGVFRVSITLPCSHSFCVSCIGTWSMCVCPQCKKDFSKEGEIFTKLVDDVTEWRNKAFPFSLQNSEKSKDEEFCDVHLKIKDIFCLSCNILLCERCALLNHSKSAHECVESFSSAKVPLLQEIRCAIADTSSRISKLSDQESLYNQQIDCLEKLNIKCKAEFVAYKSKAIAEVEKVYDSACARLKRDYEVKEKKWVEGRSIVLREMNSVENSVEILTVLEETLVSTPEENNFQSISKMYQKSNCYMAELKKKSDVVEELVSVQVAPFYTKISPANVGSIDIFDRVEITVGLKVAFFCKQCNDYYGCPKNSYHEGVILSLTKNHEIAMIASNSRCTNNTYHGIRNFRVLSNDILRFSDVIQILGYNT